MISMDADRALRSDEGHLYLLRDSVQGHSSNDRTLNDGVGPIQVITPPSEGSGGSDPAMYDDGLSAVRGMLLGVALGACFWALIAGFVGMLIF